MNNLVTGATGFLGSHVAEALLARGEKVRALARKTSKLNHLQTLDVEIVFGDLTDPESVEAAVDGIDRVYHCAALVLDWGAWEAFRAANVEAVRHLLHACCKARVQRLIHVSSTDVYGFPDRPVDESAPRRKRGFRYVDTKIEGEEILWDFYQETKLPITVVRPATIYGPRSPTFPLQMITLLRNGGMFHISGGGKTAGLAYVSNVVDVMLLAADSTTSIGHIYNVCDGSRITWKVFVNGFAQMIGLEKMPGAVPYRLAYFAGWVLEMIYGGFKIASRPALTRHTAEIFGTHQLFAIDKARQELGFNPRIEFEEGMARTRSWLQDMKHI